MRYEMVGGDFPVVQCYLNDGEQMITEKGSMVWMTPNLEMKTSGGGIGKMFSKAFSGESIFQNIYTAKGSGMIAFGSSFPGEIKVLEIHPGKPFILQKSAFLAGSKGIDLSIHFQKKLSSGFFGGEGFILQKVSGEGLVFMEIDGKVVEYDLKAGEQLIVDTGNVAGFEASVEMDLYQVKGASNILFGGEGLFNTRLTGPGKVYLQTMPVSNVAMALRPFIPTSNS